MLMYKWQPELLQALEWVLGIDILSLLKPE